MAFNDEQRIVLYETSWSFYEHLLEQLTKSHVRVAFNRGILELYRPSRRHEIAKCDLIRLYDVLAQELDLESDGFGGSTWKRADLQVGIDPDSAFYTTHASLVRGQYDFDITITPPPDLVFQLDLNDSLLNKLEIYATLGIPEVWSFDNEVLTVHRLQSDKSYLASADSKDFTTVGIEAINRWMAVHREESSTTWTTRFRTWVSENTESIRQTVKNYFC